MKVIIYKKFKIIINEFFDYFYFLNLLIIFNLLDNKEDNLIKKIFGGKLSSSVLCKKCKNCSTRIDNFIDISLVIYLF